jgi:hypothetical protein
MFNTIDQMTHYVRTSFGDSDNSYSKGLYPFHGILQGNGAELTIWTMVSTPILNQMQATGCGAYITNPNTRVTTIIPALAFVDDTDLLQSITSSESKVTDTTKALRLRDKGLRTTGGALVAEKCCWYTILHKWDKIMWRLATKD